jgi:hypothetical protein
MNRKDPNFDIHHGSITRPAKNTPDDIKSAMHHVSSGWVDERDNEDIRGLRVVKFRIMSVLLYIFCFKSSGTSRRSIKWVDGHIHSSERHITCFCRKLLERKKRRKARIPALPLQVAEEVNLRSGCPELRRRSPDSTIYKMAGHRRKFHPPSPHIHRSSNPPQFAHLFCSS